MREFRLDHRDPTTVSLAQPVELGAFRIDRVLGRGGMGVVWHGMHLEQQVPVAVKVLPMERSRQAENMAAFRDEVRRLAQFSHPGIVIVFDYGEITTEAAESIRSQLPTDQWSIGSPDVGSPYLVMEYCDGGDLERRVGHMTWADLRQTLLAVLDALAHAHARGIVHRDIKPANILFKNGDGQSVVKLTDFGIALAEEEGTRSLGKQVAGTLPYMAPEQFGGWRDQGPWTDLYSLGCVAYKLATGRRPFEAPTPLAYIAQHTYQPVPPMVRHSDVPEEFEGWVRRLLEKKPADRFDCAADAAFALASIWGDIESAVTLAGPEGTTLAFEEWMTTQSFADTGPTQEPDPELDIAAAGAVPPMESLEAPFPETWRAGIQPQAAMSLIGAGIGLYEWRTLPLVGREFHRDQIWRVLARVKRIRKPELVLLHGDAGYGKNRLAHWTAQRALEVGASTVLMNASHSPIAGPTDGLGPMLSRHLRCRGLELPDSQVRVQNYLAPLNLPDSYEPLALTEFVTGRGDTGLRFQSPVERYLLLYRFLTHLATKRPVVVLLENVQWGRDALGFVEFVLARQAETPLPILFLATVLDDELQQRPVEREIVEALREERATTSLEVGALPEREQIALVGQLLRLEGRLAQRVRERTSGNPLFAVQLVGDWVRRGVLRVGQKGFELAAGEEASIPLEIHELWQARIERVTCESEHAETALEAAAALGSDVDHIEWRDVCDGLGVSIPGDLVDALLDTHLAEPESHGWRFAHGMMRESIRRTARAAGRWERLNLACAEMLQEHSGSRGTAERLGRHLLEADRFEDSLEPLLRGALESLSVSEYRNAEELLDLGQDNLRRMRVPERDPRHGQGMVARIRVHIGLGRYDEAARLAARAVDSARRFRWTALYSRALRFQALTFQKQGDLGLAETVLIRAHVEAERSRDIRQEALCQLHLSAVARMLGDPTRALDNAEESLGLFERIRDEEGIGKSQAEIGNIKLLGGDLAAAQKSLTRALQSFEKMGYSYGVASTRNSLADILRQQGRGEEAEEEYLQAERICERVGTPERTVIKLNRGLLQLERGDYDEAQQTLGQGLRVVQADGRRHLQAYFRIALLACAAAGADWSAWDRHIDRAESLLAETGSHDADLAWPAQRAADVAFRAGQAARATRALRIAHSQWQGLGRLDEMGDVSGQLASIEEV